MKQILENIVNQLFNGLNKLGLRLADEPKITVMDLPTREFVFGDKNWFELRGLNKLHLNKYDILITLSTHDVKQHTASTRLFYDGDIITNENYTILSDSYTVDMIVYLNNQPLKVFMSVEPKSILHEPYKLTVFMHVTLYFNNPYYLEHLYPYFTSVGFKYNFHQDHKARDSLSAIAQQRVPVEIVDNHPSRKSRAFGVERIGGFDISILLYLQDPNLQNCLKCYEVELSSGGMQNIPNTPEIAPETIWQPEENHYCMIGYEGFPLIPVKIDKISGLVMSVDYKGSSPDLLFDLLEDLPLCVTGSNQWFARGQLGRGNLELLYRPEWDNKALLSYQQIGPRRMPNLISRTLKTMNSIKNNLSQRL